MSESDEVEYLLGTDLQELNRLGFQHRVWAAECRLHWERAGFGPGMTLLDVGAGPGFASIDLAYLVGPEGSVLAVDQSARFLGYLRDQLQRQGLEHVSLVHSPLSDAKLPEGTIDGAYARWLLCFAQDPTAVLDQIALALRPGGRLAIMDYFHYAALTLAPRVPALDRVIEAVCESWSATGGDLDIGSRLPALLDQAGFRVLDLQPVVHTPRPGENFWEWPRRFFRGYVPRLIELGHLTADEGARFFEEWDARESDPNSFLMTPPMLLITAEKK